MTIKRIRNEPLLPTRFSLGRAGLAVNIFSVLFSCLALVVTFFPTSPKPEAATMNWNILVYGAVILFSVVYFIFRGRHRYVGPVEYTKKDF